MSAANENEAESSATQTTQPAPPEPADEDVSEETAEVESDETSESESEEATQAESEEATRAESKEAEESSDDSEESGWTDVSIRAALEAMFFAADDPLPMKNLLGALKTEDESLVRRAIGQMKLEWTGDARGIHLVEVAGGFQLRTNPTYNEAVLELLESKPTRISRAAMETLAIVSYRQPVTKAVVDDIRGVDCGGVLRSLTDVELIAVIGKADDIGRPNLYGTTTRFLEFFGLDSLTDLPTLDDFEMDALELLGEDFDELLADVEGEDDGDAEQGEDGPAEQKKERMSGKALTPSRQSSPDDETAEKQMSQAAEAQAQARPDDEHDEHDESDDEHDDSEMTGDDDG